MSIEEALRNSRSVNESIQNALSGIAIRDELKDKIVAGYYSVAQQHHISIAKLMEEGLHSSAAALVRPLVDSSYRGQWFALIASDELLHQFNSGEDIFRRRQTWKLAKAIDDYLEASPNTDIDKSVFHDIYARISPVLHDLTHCGLNQVARQFSEDGDITPSFSDEELIELLRSSNSQLGMLGLGLGIAIDNMDVSLVSREIILNSND